MNAGYIIAFLIFILGITIPLTLSIYVYHDAKRREMNAVVWTLITLFVPSLIGFVIYLVVRTNNQRYGGA